MATPTIAKLRQMSDSELITMHDRLAPSTSTGVAYCLDELSRRDQLQQAKTMLECTEQMLTHTSKMLTYTRWLTWLTIAVTVATIVNLTAIFLRH
jgi:hypothetical protein